MNSQQNPVTAPEQILESPAVPQPAALNPILTPAEHKRLMYGALCFWVLISLFVLFRPFLMELPPVRVVVTLLLALPIALFWFIFWPQSIVAKIAPSPFLQVGLMLSGPIILFLLFWGLIERPLKNYAGPSGKVFVVRPDGDENYPIHHYGEAELTRDNANNSIVEAYFIPHSEKVLNGHLKAIYVVFANGDSEFTASYRPSSEHKAVKVHFVRTQDFVVIPKVDLQETTP